MAAVALETRPRGPAARGRTVWGLGGRDAVRERGQGGNVPPASVEEAGLRAAGQGGCLLLKKKKKIAGDVLVT